MTGHTLQIRPGHAWTLLFEPRVGELGARLACILGLSSCQKHVSPRLIVVKQNRPGLESIPDWKQIDADVVRHLPEAGWAVQHLGCLNLWTHQELPDVVAQVTPQEHPDLDIIRMQYLLFPVYEKVLAHGGLPLHAALVAWGRQAVLLAAPGSTGKSTCCSRIPLPWRAWSDDQALIVKDDMMSYEVHPLPTWSRVLPGTADRSWSIGQHLSLAALFFLEQSRFDRALTIGEGEAAGLITQSVDDVLCSSMVGLDREREIELRTRLFKNACELAKTIPAYRLGVSLTGRFWEEMERVLLKRV